MLGQAVHSPLQVQQQSLDLDIFNTDVAPAVASHHVQSDGALKDVVQSVRPDSAIGADQVSGLIHPAPTSQHVQFCGDQQNPAHTDRHQSLRGQDVLNPEAEVFQVRDKNLVHHDKLYPDLVGDWAHVQQVQAGGVGNTTIGTGTLWDSDRDKTSNLRGTASVREPQLLLPFQMCEDIPSVLGLAPKQVHKVNHLLDNPIKLPCGTFTDKTLPTSAYDLKVNEVFTGDYYVALHNVTAAPGIRHDGTSYAAYTPLGCQGGNATCCVESGQVEISPHRL